MGTWAKYALFVIVCTALAAASTRAQVEESYGSVQGPKEKPKTLTGVVIDQFGAVIPGVKVLATDRKGKTFETTTDNDGLYKLELLSGRYRIFFKPNGYFTPVVIGDYQMPRSSPMHLDVSLPCGDPCKTVY